MKFDGKDMNSSKVNYYYEIITNDIDILSDMVFSSCWARRWRR